MTGNEVDVSCYAPFKIHDAENFPKSLPVRPVVGDMIQSRQSWNGWHLVLRVDEVTFEPKITGGWMLEVNDKNASP